MIEEAYCNSEIVELLKEKGMDKECFTHYIQKNNSDGTSEAVITCTQQMAMRWLREEYKIYVDVSIYIITQSYVKYNVNVYYKKETNSMYSGIHLTKEHSNYEQAVESGVKYCLENLI